MRIFCQKLYLNVHIIIAFLFSFQFTFAQQQVYLQKRANVVSLSSELKPFYDIASLPVYRDQTIMAQTSSYDTTGGNDDGFSGKYSYLRKLNDSALVIFDVDGPGVINRIWTPTPSEDSLQFYLDDSTHASFTIMYKDLFSGKIFPFTKPLCNNQLGGYYCYVPLAFQRHCRIVYLGKQTQFHQIGYRLFPKGTVVKKFNPELNTEEKAALQKVDELWSKKTKTAPDYQSLQPGTLQTYKTRVQLESDKSSTIFQVAKGGRLVGIELGPASAFEELYKNVDIKITWDNEVYPAVYCPVADFFGYAFGRASMQSLLIGTAANKNYCYFPMPFDRSAKIELISRKTATSSPPDLPLISANIYFTSTIRNVNREGKFYAFWNNEPHVPLHQPHVFLQANGKGHYVGSVLQAKGLEAGMTTFFEGDDSTVIDGQMRMHGTGSEDYFNGGWYAMMDRWDGPFSLPLSGALDYSLPLNQTGGYRLFLSDKLSFEKSIYHSMEHGPEHNEKPASYTSVAYYYANTPPLQVPTPKSNETIVSLPDTLILYPQLFNFSSAGDIGIKHRWAYPTGGESFIFSTSNESAIRISMPEVPNGQYKVFVDYAQMPEGCFFSFWQRQTLLTQWINSNASDTVRVERQYLSTLSLTQLNHAITIKLRANANKTQLFLNRIILVKMEE